MRNHRSNLLLKVEDVDLFVVAMDNSLAPVDGNPVRPLRAPQELPSPKLSAVEILHRPPQTAWIRDDSVRANTLLAGLSSYLRNKDPK